MVEIFPQHITQSKYLRLAVHQREHNNSHGILKLSIGIQLIQHNIRVGVTFKLYNDAHSVSVGFVADRRDTVNTLVTAEVGNALQQARLVYHIRNFIDYNAGMIVLLHYISPAAENNFPSAGKISGAYAAVSHNNAARWEIGTLDTGHQFLNGNFGIFNHHYKRVDNLSQIMRRDICSHTHGNAVASVYKKIGES